MRCFSLSLSSLVLVDSSVGSDGTFSADPISVVMSGASPRSSPPALASYVPRSSSRSPESKSSPPMSSREGSEPRSSRVDLFMRALLEAFVHF